VSSGDVFPVGVVPAAELVLAGAEEAGAEAALEDAGAEPVHVPKLAWQPVPQNAAPTSHHPYSEQHCPVGHMYLLVPPHVPLGSITPDGAAAADDVADLVAEADADADLVAEAEADPELEPEAEADLVAEAEADLVDEAEADPDLVDEAETDCVLLAEALLVDAELVLVEEATLEEEEAVPPVYQLAGSSPKH